MKRCCLTAVWCALFWPALAQAQSAQAKAPNQQVAPLRWPLPYMQDLPADYLERQRASLVAGTNCLDPWSAPR